MPCCSEAATAKKRTSGKPIFSPDRGHLHHRLLGLGFSKRRAVLIIYGICLLLGGTALTLTGIKEGLAVLFAALAILVWGFWSKFARTPKESRK